MYLIKIIFIFSLLSSIACSKKTISNNFSYEIIKETAGFGTSKNKYVSYKDYLIEFKLRNNENYTIKKENIAFGGIQYDTLNIYLYKKGCEKYIEIKNGIDGLKILKIDSISTMFSSYNLIQSITTPKVVLKDTTLKFTNYKFYDSAFNINENKARIFNFYVDRKINTLYNLNFKTNINNFSYAGIYMQVNNALEFAMYITNIKVLSNKERLLVDSWLDKLDSKLFY